MAHTVPVFGHVRDDVDDDVWLEPAQSIDVPSELDEVAMHVVNGSAKLGLGLATMKDADLVTAICKSADNVGTEKPRATEDDDPRQGRTVPRGCAVATVGSPEAVERG